ncbi:MAG: peptidylprolyl isomerase, partial [Lentisphaeria bacterium]
KAIKEGLDKNINNAEIIDSIVATIGDQVTTDGVFDYKKYSSLNERYRVFLERRAKNQIIVQRLQTKYKKQIVVTDAEVLAGYKSDNVEYGINALVFKNADFESKVAVDENEIKKYFEENKSDFEIPEQMIVSYVTFAGADYASEIKVSEEIVKEKYEAARKVKASHILIDVAATATDAEKAAAKSKAAEILVEVKKGEKSFGDLAKEFSSCPSKNSNGDLDWFNRKAMVPEFSSAAFALKKDEVSELVQTQFGYHIIKVTDLEESYDSLSAEKKTELLVEMKNEQAGELAGKAAYEFSTQVYNAVSNSKDPNLTSLNFFETRARVAKKEVVRSEPFIAGTREAIEGISSLKFSTDVKLLSKDNPISEAIQGDGNLYYVACFVDSIAAHVPEFEKALEAKKTIKKDLLAKKAGIEAEKAAKDAADKISKLKAEGRKVSQIIDDMKMIKMANFKAKESAPLTLAAGSDVKAALKEKKVGDLVGPQKGFTGYDVV